ncbi:rCG49867 [Rattus norvegicus]|uniref:RCG49867 n=1 Tax=Rattus norvegicus TaxID=10116 RepID=A6K4N2_RAT|nr:rCG49867 [Rattus norvegicus]
MCLFANVVRQTNRRLKISRTPQGPS